MNINGRHVTVWHGGFFFIPFAYKPFNLIQMPRIKTIDYENSQGRLREIYDDLRSRRGKLASVHTIQSLRPESIVHHMDLYMEIMFSRSELSRAEREMMAVVVSVANGCSYCRNHHSQALNHYWRNEEKIAMLVNKKWDTFLTEKEQALCLYSRHLTLEPSAHEDQDFTLTLREAGLSDPAILDATLVIAYFNFVNRIVLSLDVELEEGGAGGYRY